MASSWACATLTPGLRRPTMASVLPHVRQIHHGGDTSVFLPGAKRRRIKAGGSTPTTVTDAPFKVTALPTIAGSPDRSSSRVSSAGRRSAAFLALVCCARAPGGFRRRGLSATSLLARRSLRFAVVPAFHLSSLCSPLSARAYVSRFGFLAGASAATSAASRHLGFLSSSSFTRRRVGAAGWSSAAVDSSSAGSSGR